MKSTFIILSTFLIFFIGCGGQYHGPVGPVEIIKKEHIPAHLEIYYMPLPVGVPTGIKDYKYMPVGHEWILYYKGFNNRGEQIFGRIRVSEEKYKKYSIGDKIFVN